MSPRSTLPLFSPWRSDTARFWSLSLVVSGQMVEIGSLRTRCFWLVLAVTDGQRVGLATRCAALEGPLLAQRVDSVPAEICPSLALAQRGSDTTPQSGSEKCLPLRRAAVGADSVGADDAQPH